ncbi:MAG: signal peptidase I [Candidatus Odinarchaeota archaeon]
MAGKRSLILVSFIFFSILLLFTFLTSGNTIRVVLSNSMTPAYSTGDLVVIDTRYEPSELKTGDVILYKRFEFRELTVIHRIYDVHVENGINYFAVKGDANDQPDFTKEQEGVINKKLTVKFYEKDEIFELNVTASYYNEQFIVGKVISRFPSAGWIFVPFQSELQLYTLIAVLAIIGIVFFGLYYLNKYLNENFDYLFRIFRDKSGNLRLNGEVSTKSLVPLMVFVAITMGMVIMVTPQTGIYTDVQEFQLENDGFSDAGSSNLLNATYRGSITLAQSGYHQSNLSVLDYQLNKTGNRLHINKVINYTVLWPEGYSASSPVRETNGTEILEYEVVLDQDFFITATSEAGRFALHRFPDHIAAIDKYNGQLGYIAGGFYYTATTGNYYHTLTGKEYRVLILTNEYHFIQDLMVYDGASKLYFDLETGFLILEESNVTLELWPIPALIAVIFSAVFGSFYYWVAKKRKETVLKRKFLQMMANLSVQPEEVIMKPLNGPASREFGDQQESVDDKENKIDS